jgi:DNA-binding CsgD family transcriptional regulator
MTLPSQLPSQPLIEPIQLPKLRLTERELEVAYFVAQDYSDVQIAYVLSIEIDTVKKHIGRSLNKLRVRGRVGLAIWYVQSYGFPPYRLSKLST